MAASPIITFTAIELAAMAAAASGDTDAFAINDAMLIYREGSSAAYYHVRMFDTKIASYIELFKLLNNSD